MTREEIAAKMLLKLQDYFPIGARVRMTEEAAKRFPRRAGKEATVVGYHNGVAPKIKWDDLKTPTSYAPWFLERTDAKLAPFPEAWCPSPLAFQTSGYGFPPSNWQNSVGYRNRQGSIGAGLFVASRPTCAP